MLPPAGVRVWLATGVTDMRRGMMVAHLKLLIAKLKRDRFGASAERGRKLLDQLEMQLEELETAAAEDEAAAAHAAPDKTTVRPFMRAKPVRAPLPAHLSRERVVLPSPTSCPCCGGKLAKLGETITETLESIPRSYKVIQTVREKFSCRCCETITQPPAPFHVIARGRAGPDLLATIMHGKFGEHQPLNRQSERFACEGIDLSVSTLADWVGGCTTALSPLVMLIKAHVLAAERIHGDETTVPVLAKVKTITGRIWTYVRDDQPFGGPAPPAAIFFYSRDRGGEHPCRHLAGYAGILQADAYAGFNDLYHPARTPGPITEAACWAHGRRKLFVLADVAKAPLAIEAVRRIDAIFDVERDINGLPATQRHAMRQLRVAPLITSLETWMRGERSRLSRHADVAKAMDYMLKRWDAFTPSGRWPHLPDQQCGGAYAAWHCSRAQVVAVCRFGPRRGAGVGDVFADRDREAERGRSARLARRRAGTHRRSPGLPPRRIVTVALAAPERGS
jgi:transposase